MAKHATMQTRDVVAAQSRLTDNLRDVLVSMIEEDPNMRARSAKEVLERLTLRKIVALGLAATEEQGASAENTPTAFKMTEAAVEVPSRGEDPRMAAAAERRKARLRSLLDSL